MGLLNLITAQLLKRLGVTESLLTCFNETVVSSATYTTTNTDGFIKVGYTVTDVATITLGTLTAEDRRFITVKDSGGNANTKNITVATEGAEKIDDADTATINSDYGAMRFYWDGSSWSAF